MKRQFGSGRANLKQELLEEVLRLAERDKVPLLELIPEVMEVVEVLVRDAYRLDKATAALYAKAKEDAKQELLKKMCE